jgi:hypothetical protein
MVTVIQAVLRLNILAVEMQGSNKVLGSRDSDILPLTD